MDSDFAEIKFVTAEGDTGLKLGEFRLDRNNSVVNVGCGDFPLKEEEQGSNEVGGTSG